MNAPQPHLDRARMASREVPVEFEVVRPRDASERGTQGAWERWAIVGLFVFVWLNALWVLVSS
jgi:hypothetical protein